MRQIKRLFCGLLLVILALQVTGCGLPGNDNTDKQYTDNSQIEEEGNKKNNLAYGRSQSIVLDVEMDFDTLGIEYFDDAVELYQDEGLTNKIYCKYDWDKGRKILSLSPPKFPVLNISSVFATSSLLQKYDHSDYDLFDRGQYNDWGNLGKMYMVEWLNLQTGEKLAKPQITEIAIKGELDTPDKFQFEVSEHGNGILSWEPVDGAEQYLVVSATYLDDDTIGGFYQDCDIIVETTDTMWQSQTQNDTMNFEFQMGYDYEDDREYYYGVIAIGEEGTSMISNMISKSEMAKRLPFCKEENGNDGEFEPARFAKSIDLLSRYQWIQLCDGTMAQRLICYNMEEVEVVNITDWNEEPEEMLQLPYTVDGTDFEGHFYVEEFNRDAYQEELEELQVRQNILKSKMTGMLKNVEITVKPEIIEERQMETGSNSEIHDNEGSGEQKNASETMVENPVGTSELSRYLASCLLRGEEYISVAGVQEKVNEEALTDAFYEAYYQNPLVPAVKELTISQSGAEVYVSYEESIVEWQKKQQEVIKQVNFVAGELAEDGMSDVDKVLAINSYLCDNITYDEKMAAQFSDEQPEFSDSMTPYGALIEHKAVCLGYAGAFQLLAKAMGLDSIVVTGALNGNQNHAWNKVKINEKWCVVDVTSNDGQDIANAFLNVSDKVAGLMLKEDNRYLCDTSIGQYSADTDEFEYYHLAGRYFELDVIAEELAKELSMAEKAVFRTTETLNDEEFQAIVKEVMDNMGETEMQGYYQTGIIYLEKK